MFTLCLIEYKEPFGDRVKCFPHEVFAGIACLLKEGSIFTKKHVYAIEICRRHYRLFDARPVFSICEYKFSATLQFYKYLRTHS